MPFLQDSFLLILLSPSGGGKSTICDLLMAEDESLEYSISCTTRQPRGNELDGKDYFFLKREEFLRRRSAGEFLETAEVHGNWYGTSLDYIQKKLTAGKTVILDVDIQGALKIMQQEIPCVTVFILPPSQQELESRLKKRNTDKEEDIAVRLRNARQEIESAEKFDYLVINDDLNRALKDVKCIIRAERLKQHRYRDFKKEYYRSDNVKSESRKVSRRK